MGFNKHIKEKAGICGYWLLLVDGHSSHVNLNFLDYVDKNRIIVLVLSPHATYQFQPLDIGLFSPLSKAYSLEVSNYFASGQSFVSMSKRLFYRFFKNAWEVSFTKSNIETAWRATGIWPDNLNKALAICTQKPPSISTKKKNVRFLLKTPISSHAMR